MSAGVPRTTSSTNGPPFGGAPILPQGASAASNNSDGDSDADSDSDSDSEVEIRYVVPQTSNRGPSQPPNGAVPPGITWPPAPTRPNIRNYFGFTFPPGLGASQPPPPPPTARPGRYMVYDHGHGGGPPFMPSYPSRGRWCLCGPGGCKSGSDGDDKGDDDDDSDSDKDAGKVTFKLVPAGLHPDVGGGMDYIKFPVAGKYVFSLDCKVADVLKKLKAKKEGLTLLEEKGAWRWASKKKLKMGKRVAKKTLKEIGLKDKQVAWLAFGCH